MKTASIIVDFVCVCAETSENLEMKRCVWYLAAVICLFVTNKQGRIVNGFSIISRLHEAVDSFEFVQVNLCLPVSVLASV